MASIYKKPPQILQAKVWDEKMPLSETYKLQSNDTHNKVKAKVHQDSGQLGI
jgi:LysM repeat protein